MNALMWARQPKEADVTHPGISESERWIEGYDRIAETQATMPQMRPVYLADREADMVAPMQCAPALGVPANWLIRAWNDRCLQGGGKLWAATRAQVPLREFEFSLASRQGQAERLVRQRLWAHAAELPAPERGRVRVTCVIASEIEAPAGIKPIEWRLITNRTVWTLESAMELIAWYCCRWVIETLFHVLKNGCRVEALQLDSQTKLELALAHYLVVSWRIAHVVCLGRIDPNLPADHVLCLGRMDRGVRPQQEETAQTTAPVRKVVRQIAQLGGVLAHKADGEPGVKSLWLGMARLRDFALTVEHMRGLGHAS